MSDLAHHQTEAVQLIFLGMSKSDIMHIDHNYVDNIVVSNYKISWKTSPLRTKLAETSKLVELQKAIWPHFFKNKIKKPFQLHKCFTVSSDVIHYR